jgi:ABC-type transport system involved in multi-copper enzyme maturation permease subunit
MFRAPPNLALFNRTLMLDMRGVSSYALRLVWMGVMMFMVWQYERTLNRGTMATALGLKMFTLVAYVNLVFVTIAAIGLFANAVTEEREDNTLPLLVMTGMTPFSLLASKGSSRLIAVIMLLAVQLPFTILSITMGGITVVQVLAAHLAIAAYLVFICGLALFASTVASRSQQASGLTMIGLGLFYFAHVALSLIVDFALKIAGKRGSPLWDTDRFEFWNSVSPFRQMEVILGTTFAGPIVSVQVLSNIVFGFLFFGLAVWAFNRADRRHVGEASGERLVTPKSPLKKLTAGRCWTNAIAWKEFNFCTGGRGGIVLRCVMYVMAVVLPLIVSQFSISPMRPHEIGDYMAMSGILILALEIAAISSRVLNHDIVNKTHGSLMALPRSTGRIVRDKVYGVLLSLIPGVAYTLIGVFLSPDVVSEFVYELDEPAIWAMLFGYVFFIYLIVYLSMLMKHGATAVAVLFCIVLFGVTGALIGTITRSDDSAFVCLMMVSFMGAFYLHMTIGEAMVKAAACED